MASNETDLFNMLLPWMIGGITIISSVYAGVKLITRYLICRGKNQANGENRITLLENRINNIIDEFDKIKEWAESEHETMNQATKEAFDKLDNKIDTVKDDLHEIKGYMKGLSEKK